MSDLFYDRFVLTVIRATLVSQGIRGKRDLEAAMRDVVLACIGRARRSGRPPEDVGQATAMALTVANAVGGHAARKGVRREKADARSTAGANEQAPERGAEPARVERMLAAIRDVLKDDPVDANQESAGAAVRRPLEAPPDAGAGVPREELAGETGALPPATRKPVERSPEKARSARSANAIWIAGSLGVLLVGTIAVYVGSVRNREDETAKPRAREELAATPRQSAANACKEQRWEDCEKALDRAAEADPEGDRSAEATALRKEIAAGRGATRADEGGDAPAGETVPTPTPMGEE